MERINLTKERKVYIPATINGKDVDLPFNAEDMKVRTAVIAMASDIADYEMRGSKLVELANTKTPDGVTKALADAKAFANEGLELCKTLSSSMTEVVEGWAEIVGDNFLSLDIFEALIGCMQKLITEKEVEKKVTAQLEDER